MRTKKWLTAVALPAGLLALSSIANAAGTVDCTNYTVKCFTLLKGSTKFKPTFTALCPDQPTTLSVKGTLYDCTVANQSGPSAVCVGGTNPGDACTSNSTGGPGPGCLGGGLCGVQIISGGVKGTLNTTHCDCAHLLSANPVSGSLNTTFKFLTKDAGGNALPSCSATLSTLNLGGAAVISPGALLPGGDFDSGAVYGAFSLKTNTSIAGIFQGSDGGTTSKTTGSTVESVNFILNSCAGAKGLKGITFGATDSILQ
jgi:hypothetical protein